MSNETSKCYEKRIKDKVFDKFLHGNGIDIGCGTDILKLPPGTGKVRGWDKHDGDAALMQGIADNTFDFVYSSHCLEHLNKPEESLKKWIAICKPGGYIYVVVPDWELYEKKVFPSMFGVGHQWTFSAMGGKKHHKHIIIYLLLETLMEKGLIVNRHYPIFTNNMNYDFTLPNNIDQTRGNACAQIEFVMQKEKP